MADLFERITEIEETIRKTPHHKGTEHYLGQLKARLSKLKKRAEESSQKRSGLGFIPKKFGDATVVLVGPPSVGKSTLLNQLTRAHSRVEPWPFSTLKVVPGILDYQGAKIQIFDLPGIIKGAAKGVGRGREALSAAKSADLLLLILDPETYPQVNSFLEELLQAGINLPFLVVVNKADLLKKQPPVEKIKVFHEFRTGAKFNIQTKDTPGVASWRSKVEISTRPEAMTLPDVDGKKCETRVFFISAEKKIGLEKLKEAIWQNLGLIRVYLKPKDQKPDFSQPLILRKDHSVSAVAQKIFFQEKDFQKVLVWGKSARFPGQQVSLGHQLADEDILSFS